MSGPDLYQSGLDPQNGLKVTLLCQDPPPPPLEESTERKKEGKCKSEETYVFGNMGVGVH
jgi:hypothetical protein